MDMEKAERIMKELVTTYVDLKRVESAVCAEGFTDDLGEIVSLRNRIDTLTDEYIAEYKAAGLELFTGDVYDMFMSKAFNEYCVL